MIRTITGTSLIALTLSGAFAQSVAKRPTFEVASVKPNKTAVSPTVDPLPGGQRFLARNMPLSWLIGMAYNISIRQISLPNPFDSERYDIEAKVDRPASREQMMRMLQTLLEERFHLILRREIKQLTAHVLVVAKGGPRLNENQDGAELDIRKVAAGKTSYKNMPMTLFANVLAGAVDDTVLDRTGLDGSYDFTLEYTPERLGRGVLEGREPAPNPNGLSLFDALQEQLGLKLESIKGPVETTVVDHIEHPSEN